MFMTLIDTRFLSMWRILVSSPLQSCQLPGRKLAWAISAEIYNVCTILLFLDHILYRRAHFVCNALRESRAVLAIIGREHTCNLSPSCRVIFSPLSTSSTITSPFNTVTLVFPRSSGRKFSKYIPTTERKRFINSNNNADKKAYDVQCM